MLGPQCPDTVNYPWIMVFSHRCSQGCSFVAEALLSVWQTQVQCTYALSYRSKQLRFLYHIIHHIEHLIYYSRANGASADLCVSFYTAIIYLL